MAPANTRERRGPLERVLAASSLLAALIGAAVSGCTGGAGPETETISEETFIAVYVDLRATAIRSGLATPTEAERITILEQHGVTEFELVAFANAHGGDLDTMVRIWDTVEATLDTMKPWDNPDGRTGDEPLDREPSDRGR